MYRRHYCQGQPDHFEFQAACQPERAEIHTGLLDKNRTLWTSFDELGIKETFIEGVRQYIRESARSYWAKRKQASLQ